MVVAVCPSNAPPAGRQPILPSLSCASARSAIGTPTPSRRSRLRAGVVRPGRRAGLRWLIAVGGGWSDDVLGLVFGVRWFPFPREVIAVAVRWYLRYGLSYRDVEELLAERGITVDHVTVYRWVQRFTPRVHRGRPARSARSRRPVVRRRNIRQGRRSVDLPPPGDQHGQVIDVLLSERRDLAAARRFFTRALRGHDPGRGHHRPSPGLPASPGRTDPLSTAYHRALAASHPGVLGFAHA